VVFSCGCISLDNHIFSVFAVDTQIDRINVLYDKMMCELLRNYKGLDLNVGKVCNHPLPADISVGVILGTGAKVLHSCCKTWSEFCVFSSG